MGKRIEEGLKSQIDALKQKVNQLVAHEEVLSAALKRNDKTIDELRKELVKVKDENQTLKESLTELELRVEMKQAKLIALQELQKTTSDALKSMTGKYETHVLKILTRGKIRALYDTAYFHVRDAMMAGRVPDIELMKEIVRRGLCLDINALGKIFEEMSERIFTSEEKEIFKETLANEAELTKTLDKMNGE
jgi:predicted nuclease with TOPRIM domain